MQCWMKDWKRHKICLRVISEEAQEANTSSPLKFKIELMKPSMKKVRVPYMY